ncbi:class I adenylate-forming enzyme family protein [Actinokineospora pegani]|uniref:class I adenylate-forming enzyme family protein n=1 Tax=Actinokineospora pegani TaxID=2654637 RepID=UPI0012EAD1DC|nr:class I adenylate-forming enzyme family protein [Actinokineospora pegani]
MAEVDLAEVLAAACAEHAGRTAVVDGADRVSYTELSERVRSRAAELDAVLGPDRRRVGIHADNSLEYLVSYYALIRSGRLPMLVDAKFGAVELAAIASGCGVGDFLTAAPAKFPLPAEIRPVADSALSIAALDDPPATAPRPRPDTATCRFTSGTTGEPKCLEFSGRAVLAAARNWVAGTGLGADDRVLCLASFSNGLAFNTSLLPVLLVGGELHLYRGLPSSRGITRAVAAARPTRLVAFPLAYRVLGEAPAPDVAPFATLSRAVSAASVLAPGVRADFERVYGVPIADYYGIAEAGPCTYERDADRGEGLGTALPGVSLRIVELPTGEHEVRVRTESMSSGYLNAPDLLAERVDADGYYRTGDRGRVEDGRLFVTGRLGGPINLAGRKVDPVEVEQVLRVLDGVAEAVVFADADANGEAVLHAVLGGPRPPSRDEVIRHCRAGLAAYKVPGRVSYLAAVPRSTTGKVRMAELRALVGTTESDRSS